MISRQTKLIAHFQNKNPSPVRITENKIKKLIMLRYLLSPFEDKSSEAGTEGTKLLTFECMTFDLNKDEGRTSRHSG